MIKAPASCGERGSGNGRARGGGSWRRRASPHQCRKLGGPASPQFQRVRGGPGTLLRPPCAVTSPRRLRLENRLPLLAHPAVRPSDLPGGSQGGQSDSEWSRSLLVPPTRPSNTHMHTNTLGPPVPRARSPGLEALLGGGHTAGPAGPARDRAGAWGTGTKVHPQHEAVMRTPETCTKAWPRPGPPGVGAQTRSSGEHEGGNREAVGQRMRTGAAWVARECLQR